MTRRSLDHKPDNMVNDTVLSISTKNFYQDTSKSEDTYQKCQSCSSYRLKINGLTIQCADCKKNYLYKKDVKLYEFTDDENNQSKEEISTKPDPMNQSDSGCGARATQLSEEPEVIDLLSSDDEPSQKSSNACDHSDAESFLFEPWNIKESDRDLISFQEDCLSFKSIKFQLKACQMGRFLSEAHNSESNEATMTFKTGSDDIDGICIKLIVEESNVNITVGIEDIEYCAVMFHDPFYFLCIKVAQETCDLYYDAMKTLKSAWRDDPDGTLMNELNKGRIFAILNMKKEWSQRAATKLEKFFRYNFKNQNKLSFLNRKKAEEVVSSCFGGELDFKKYPFLKEMHKFTKKFLPEYAKNFIVKYPPEQSDAVVIKPIDMNCLEKYELLNDNVISFYLKYIQNELLTPADRSRTHVFDTFFYHRLTQSQSAKKKIDKEDAKLSAAEKRYLRVKNWTRNVNLFEKDFLIVPINKKYHWYVAIICYPYLLQPEFSEGTIQIESISENSDDTEQDLELKRSTRLRDRLNTGAIDLESEDSADEATPEPETPEKPDKSLDRLGLGACLKRPVILLFDSLRHSKKAAVVATLKQYLQSEWSAKNADALDVLSTIEGHSVQVPLQSNNFDCGIFLLQYVEHFFKEPITDYRFPINLSQWFPKKATDLKRFHIKQILIDIDRKQKESKTVSSSMPGKQPQIETVIENRGGPRAQHLARPQRPTSRDCESSMDFEETSSEATSSEATRVGDILMDIDSLR